MGSSASVSTAKVCKRTTHKELNKEPKVDGSGFVGYWVHLTLPECSNPPPTQIRITCGTFITCLDTTFTCGLGRSGARLGGDCSLKNPTGDLDVHLQLRTRTSGKQIQNILKFKGDVGGPGELRRKSPPE